MLEVMEKGSRSGCSDQQTLTHFESIETYTYTLQGNGTVTPFAGNMDDYTEAVLSEMAECTVSADGKFRLQAVEGASRSDALGQKSSNGAKGTLKYHELKSDGGEIEVGKGEAEESD
jgi:hypothetical protein